MKKLSKNRLAFIASLQLQNFTLSDVVNIWTKYETGIYYKISSNGSRHTLENYKLSYLYLRNFILKLPTTPIPFCKHDSKGIPKTLWALRPLIKGSRDSQRLALTIARSYELIKLPIDYSTESIEAPGPEGLVYQETTQQFKIFLTKFVQKFPWYLGCIQHRDSHEPRVFTTLSNGPNGPAVSSSHLDAQAVMNDATLFNAITQLNDALGQNWITQWMIKQAHSFTSKKTYLTGKLGFISEPAGKTRIFAIGDYWSQTSLKVIQDSLYHTLKTISTDSTADQDRGFKSLIKESQGKVTYCFDLSSASDRIPAIMQKYRLELMGGKNLGEAWFKLMTDRTFFIKATKQNVRWKVGQPLGLLSSFPSFALWHHDIIQFAANLDRVSKGLTLRFFKDYRVLGDDVVIYNKKVAECYQYLITEVYGIQINQSKSVIGSKDLSQIEFTKRLSLNGTEMSSIKHNILTKSGVITMLDLVDIMYERDFIKQNAVYYELYTFLSHEERVQFEFMCWVRSSTALPFEGDNGALKISREEFDIMIKTKRAQNIKNKLAELDNLLMQNKPLVDLFNQASIPYSLKALGQSDLTDSAELHPLVWAINQTGLDLTLCLSTIWDDESPDVSPVEYLPIVSNKSFFQTPRGGRTEYLSSLFIDVLASIKNETLNEDNVSTSCSSLEQG